MDVQHLQYMQRAIAIAKKGTRQAYPNPSVGAIVVCNGVIIGEGYTNAYGGSHAEVNAINSVKDQSLLSKATLYVTLEPCSHYGKTPPCANLIVAKQIPKIYIGCVDTFSKVAGKGIQLLLASGCEVHVGVLEEECEELHKRFFTFHNKKRPYVLLKWAETRDGFIDKDRTVTAYEEAQPTWISNELSRQKVHQIRAQEHAILVGTNTALKDNPTLTTRSFGGESPVRILIDKSLKVPQSYHLYNGAVKTLVFTEQEATHEHVIFKKINFNENILSQLLTALYEENIQSVLVEGGRQLLTTFIAQKLWDEAKVFVGDSLFESGVLAPELEGELVRIQHFGEDFLKHYRPKA